MKTGIERFSADLARALAGDSAAQLAGAQSLFESPIEALFYTAFFQCVRLHPSYRHMDLFPLPTEGPLDPSGDVFVGWQRTILDWRVDFEVRAKSTLDDSVGRLVIECDGHDFHERTKQQAARDRGRDRALQAAGYRVMRFTGSEIFRDPMRCACEALDWCLTHFEKV